MRDQRRSLLEYVDGHHERLIELVQGLVRLQSENRSPLGSEGVCQEYVAEVLRRSGYDPDVYEPDAVLELQGHRLATPNRTYHGRPNVAVRRMGRGGGRSVVLSGHVDTVPRGDLPWTRDAFGGAIEEGRLYGRGANDMKAGVAINLFLMEALSELEIELEGDLIFESVVDEEFGGVNGTLAGRLKGYNGDAAILTEPSGLRICAGQRGGRTAHLLFSSSGGILREAQGNTVIAQLAWFLESLPAFAEQRRSACPPHPLYDPALDPVPVAVTKITTGPWGTGQPITVPEECRVELYWQMMPGEEQEKVESEFLAWLDGLIERRADLFGTRPTVSFPIRWLPGSAIDAGAPLCVALEGAARETLGVAPEIVGIEAPCDLFVFHQFGMDAVVWGPTGGKTHGSDEYVTIDSTVLATRALAAFLCDWCGVAGDASAQGLGRRDDAAMSGGQRGGGSWPRRPAGGDLAVSFS